MKNVVKKAAILLVMICMMAMVLPVSAAEEHIALNGPGGGDGPKNVRAVGDIAVKFTVPEGKMLKAFVFDNSPTWEKEDSEGEIVLFRWNTDYATTVAGQPLASHSELHADNEDFRVDVNGYAGPGTYLAVMLKDKATNDLGVWTNSKNDSGAVTFLNGQEVSYMAASFIIVDDDNPPTSDSSAIFAYIFLIATTGVVVFRKRRLFA